MLGLVRLGLVWVDCVAFGEVRLEWVILGLVWLG
jgi:hypothetical protein